MCPQREKGASFLPRQAFFVLIAIAEGRGGKELPDRQRPSALGLLVSQSLLFCWTTVFLVHFANMVCMPGHWRMGAMVRHLMVENLPDITPEDVTNEKIAAQIIRKEFLDANEANLLEEKDMHVFGCKPMTDPLHLVCCNACKKPVKASQYAAHAEICNSLNSTRETSVELDGDVGHKKPSKKGRKVAQTTNNKHRVDIDKKGQSVKVCRSVVRGSDLKIENKSMQSSQSEETRRATASIDHATANSTTQTCSGDAPAPLATKMYHSRGNYRLRLELGHLYHEASAEAHTSNHPTQNSIQENGVMASQVLLEECSRPTEDLP